MIKKISILSVIFILIDQIVKILVDNFLVYKNIIPGFLSLSYEKNYGVAFSLFSGNTILIILLSFVLIFIFSYVLYKEYLIKNENDNINNFIYALIYGGIFGNLIDRLIRGYVIDFISLNIFGYNFPVFNLADIFIVGGVLLMIIYDFKKEKILC